MEMHYPENSLLSEAGPWEQLLTIRAVRNSHPDIASFVGGTKLFLHFTEDAMVMQISDDDFAACTPNWGEDVNGWVGYGFLIRCAPDKWTGLENVSIRRILDRIVTGDESR